MGIPSSVLDIQSVKQDIVSRAQQDQIFLAPGNVGDRQPKTPAMTNSMLFDHAIIIQRIRR